MKQLLSSLALLIAFVAFGQEDKHVPFDSKNYPSDSYTIKTESYSFKDLAIDVTHVSPKDTKSGFECRFWITVKKGTKIIDGRYYANCESFEGCSGIYADKLQPKDYFILTKFGDYNGELLLIDKTGKIQKYYGGIYSISDDGSYLFSHYDSDVSGITVFDLSKNKVLFTSNTLKEFLSGIYTKDGKIFSVAQLPMKIPAKSAIHTFDFKTNTFIRTVVPDKYVKEAKQLAPSSLPQGNCQCGSKEN